MNPTRIKICGITRKEDAEVAVQAGADAIGLNFYPASPRAVSIAQALAICEHVPPFVTIVGLFVDHSAEAIRAVLSEVPLDMLQFHGDETADFCEQFDRPWIKALRMRPELNLETACSEFRGARGILLDAWREGVPGGTGESFDWALVQEGLSLPVVLAGGLNDDNVGRAVAEVRPAAVDVSSGVESAPGIKDSARINRFVAAVRRVPGNKTESQ